MENPATKNILVVDDNTVNLQLVRNLLLPYGYKGRFVISAKRALESIKRSRPDLILLDITMPEVNGFELCKILKANEETADIPIIFLSALDGEQDIVKGFNLGGVDYVTKPFKEEVLLARVNSQLFQTSLKEDLQHSNDQLTCEIEKRKLAQKTTEKSEQRLSAALEASNEGIWEWSPTNGELFLSPTFYSMLGYKNGIYNNNFEAWTSIIHSKDRAAFIQKTKRGIKELNFTIEHEFRIKRADGKYIWVLSKGSRINVKCTSLMCIFGTITDIDQQKNAEKKMKHMINFDSLTGLPNRIFLNNLLAKKIASSKRMNQKFALLFIDLNRFKIVNDSLGHSKGDVLLKDVANRLTDLIREEDAVSRLGGDEFTIFLDNIDQANDIIPVVNRIISSFHEPFFISGHQVVVGPSIGIAMYPDDAKSGEELLKRADVAMYRAKRMGTDSYSFYTSDMNKEVDDRLRIEEGLRSAIDNSQVIPHYQAKYNLANDTYEGMETLCRWIEGDQCIYPDDFIPIAIETGLILDIDHVIFKQAAIYAKNLYEKGLYSGRIAINISPLHFKQSDIVDKIKAVLDETKLPPSNIELEITEEAIVEDIDYSIGIMNELKQLGLSLALDDFGTGYSSLNHLCNFPIDTLKIDRSFIKALHCSEKHRAIVKCIVELSHNLNIKVVAEGVENCQQIAYLKELQCDYIQGFYFSKPVCGKDFIHSISDNCQQAEYRAALGG